MLDTEAGGGIRMSSETESGAALAAELAEDGVLVSTAQRCAIWDDMTRWWPRTAAAPGEALDCDNAPAVAARE